MLVPASLSTFVLLARWTYYVSLVPRFGLKTIEKHTSCLKPRLWYLRREVVPTLQARNPRETITYGNDDNFPFEMVVYTAYHVRAYES